MPHNWLFQKGIVAAEVRLKVSKVIKLKAAGVPDGIMLDHLLQAWTKSKKLMKRNGVHLGVDVLDF